MAALIGTPALPVENADAQLPRRLRDQLVARIGRQVEDLCVEVGPAGVTLSGRVPTFFIKQQVQHEVMRVTSLPVVANRLEVSGRKAAVRGEG